MEQSRVELQLTLIIWFVASPSDDSDDDDAVGARVGFSRNSTGSDDPEVVQLQHLSRLLERKKCPNVAELATTTTTETARSRWRL
ncbi:hypothetical protein PsorP6_001363 [Peronosclerospora sorghi]|uniref:Uncharacterized protein n=1 Tax=Peronosclerospora sorghi TaxID=230839 RepID=A0ACC0WSK2_9STRA|nr:hypothetical protein PsorP6_001363 [Peronosclerospora sorghi]